MNENRQGTGTAWTDPDDAPELTDAFFEEADEYVGSRRIRRGRPRSGHAKRALTIRYDADIVEAFRATGKGWQTRMNDALRDWLRDHTSVPTPEATGQPSVTQ
jgi:uncharacterized protein (DUF4415 family)